jgi:transposase
MGGYDLEAKREPVEACLRPGVSAAGMALDHGNNANWLREWIGGYRGPVASIMADPPVSLPAFAPVVSVMALEPPGFTLSVVLPNGVKLELQGMRPGDLPPLLNDLAGLPCSVSNRG